MIWIGTSGWVYPHWMERFYPPGLRERDQLEFYTRYFPTVEINRSFYRLPTYEQFRTWSQQTASHPGFCFAVKASRYITHLKKLREAGEGLERLISSAKGLGDKLGPFLYQLPPHWHANTARLEEFIAKLPHEYAAAFEFRDPTWFEPQQISALQRILGNADCALVVAIGGSSPTPLDVPRIGPFGYLRFHSGVHGIGLSDEELDFWAKRLLAEVAQGHTIYVYFNNDPEGYAIRDAMRLREMVGEAAVLPR